MESEAEIVRQACPQALIVVGAGNSSLLAHRLESALMGHNGVAAIDRIVSAGICGGLNSSLLVGDIVVGTSTLYGLSQIAADHSWSDRLYAALAPKQPSVSVSQGWFAW